MPFNGSGTYTLPAGNPVTTGTTISSTTTNNTNSDIATALTNCLTRDGQSTPSADLPMNSHKLTELAAGTSNGDSVRFEQVQYLANVSGAGTVGQVLTSAGSGSPTWNNPTLLGGVQGSILYQSAANTTSVLDPGTSGQVLASGGTGANPSWISLPISLTGNIAVFTSSGTWTCPANIVKAKITVIGGGGSAGNGVSQSGGGGGGGGTAIKSLTVTPGTVYTATVGAGGAGIASGAGNTSGNAGGTSSFSGSGITTVSATGGAGGGSVAVGGVGGLGSNGDLNLRGSSGKASFVNYNTPQSLGGGTFMSGDVPDGTAGSYGAGSGGRYDNIGSSAGSDGVVIVEY